MSVLSSWIPPDTGEVYSTEETRIGTWIDGKPIYRKVFQMHTPTSTSSGSQATDKTIENVDQIVNVAGVMRSSRTIQQWINLPAVNNNPSGYCFVTAVKDDNNTATLMVSVSIDNFKNLLMFAIIDYTKITD